MNRIWQKAATVGVAFGALYAGLLRADEIPQNAETNQPKQIFVRAKAYSCVNDTKAIAIGVTNALGTDSKTTYVLNALTDQGLVYHFSLRCIKDGKHEARLTYQVNEANEGNQNRIKPVVVPFRCGDNDNLGLKVAFNNEAIEASATNFSTGAHIKLSFGALGSRFLGELNNKLFTIPTSAIIEFRSYSQISVQEPTCKVMSDPASHLCRTSWLNIIDEGSDTNTWDPIIYCFVRPIPVTLPGYPVNSKGEPIPIHPIPVSR